MAEISIRQIDDEKNDHPEIVNERQMMLIGFINDLWHGQSRYPLPLIDRMSVRKIRTDLSNQTQTIQGIIPDDFKVDGLDKFVEGHWAGWVTLRNGTNHGWGTVYTGQGNHSTDFGAYILENPVLPYDTNKELAIVRDFEDSSVITTLEGGQYEGLYLAYDVPEVVSSLGKLSIHNLYPQE